METKQKKAATPKTTAKDTVVTKKTAVKEPATMPAIKAKNVKAAVSKASAPKAAAKPKAGTITIKQIASGYGRIKDQAATLKGLGLRKINHVVKREDTPAMRGMVNRVKHLVQIIEG